MEFSTSLMIAGMVGGIIAIWFLQTIIDVFITSRVMDDPVNGKILATISAYAIACLLYLLGANSAAGLALYLPGALLIGWLQYRKGIKIRVKMAENDVGTTFE